VKKNIARFSFPFLIFSLVAIFFAKGVNNYFLGDDWFHLNITQINNWREFLNFFNPLANPQQAAFYRPIPNQLFFFLMQSLFALNPFYYHVVIYSLFFFSIYLFNRLLILQNFPQKSRRLAIIIFCLSATHFTRLYFISASQEIFMVVFVLLYFLLFLTEKNRLKIGAQLSLMAALLSKDTAVVAPIIMFFIQNQNFLIHKKTEKNKFKIKQFLSKNWSYLISFFLVFVYLYIRFFIFNQDMIEDQAYQLNFSIKEALTSTYFYFWWLMGAPELIQDYMPKFYGFLPRFFTDFGKNAYSLIFLALLLLVLLIINFVISYKKIKNIKILKKIFLAFIFIFFGLLPFVFLPKHRFAIQLGLPMLGMAMFLATILSAHKKLFLSITSLIAFLALNFLSIKMSEKSHYSITRAIISEKVSNYFSDNYPQIKPNTIFFITNAQTVGHEIANWGSSRQIAFALWHENFIQAFYKDKSLKMKFEDLVDVNFLSTIELDNEIIYVSAEEFID
jgi:hypothetical protein